MVGDFPWFLRESGLIELADVRRKGIGMAGRLHGPGLHKRAARHIFTKLDSVRLRIIRYLQTAGIALMAEIRAHSGYSR